jgi:hypothetical protein
MNPSFDWVLQIEPKEDESTNKRAVSVDCPPDEYDTFGQDPPKHLNWHFPKLLI